MGLPPLTAGPAPKILRAPQGLKRWVFRGVCYSLLPPGCSYGEGKHLITPLGPPNYHSLVSGPQTILTQTGPV